MADGYYVPIGIAIGSKASIVELLRNWTLTKKL